MPSGQSAWTFNSALAIAMSSASVLTGLLMKRLPPAMILVLNAGCRFGRRLSRAESEGLLRDTVTPSAIDSKLCTMYYKKCSTGVSDDDCSFRHTACGRRALLARDGRLPHSNLSDRFCMASRSV